VQPLCIVFSWMTMQCVSEYSERNTPAMPNARHGYAQNVNSRGIFIHFCVLSVAGGLHGVRRRQHKELLCELVGYRG
jgi:hypothetical protein